MAVKEFSEKRTSLRQRFLRNRPEDRLPLQITHARLYILPSKRGWFFIFSLLIMLIASMNYAINLGFALCFLLTGLVASSLLGTYQNLAGMEIVSAEVTPAFANDYLHFHLRFHNNRSTKRFGIKIATQQHVHDVFSIAPHSITTSELAVTAPKRGAQYLGRITISSDYPLGLWFGWSYFHVHCRGIVYPEVETDAPPVPENRSNTEQGTNHNENSGHDEFSELKTYQPGDPQSRIAWKAVARGQGWYSKAFTEEAGTGHYHFSLDDTRDLASLEHRLSRLTAWIIHSERRGAYYSLSLPGFQSTQETGSKHRDKLLEKLALFGSEDEQ